MKIEMPFGLKIAILNREIRKEMDKKANSMGLTSVQLRVLGSISRLEYLNNQEIHQKDLEELEHVTHPAMTKMLSKLQKKGFITCTESLTDRRYKKINTTKEYQNIYKIILKHDLETFNNLCVNFSSKDKETLQLLINEIINNIQD